jgi:hypothetical protein
VNEPLRNEEVYRKRAIALLTSNGGKMTLAQLRLKQIIPMQHVAGLMERMFEERLLMREGEMYLLPPKNPQSTLPLRVGGPVTSPPAAEPDPPESFTPIGKRCVKCHDDKPRDKFPRREGMQRASRVCTDCEPVTTKSDSSREISIPEVQPQATPVKAQQIELRLTIDDRIKNYLERLVRTGLFGDTIDDAAETLIWSGIEQRLPLIAKVLT